MLLTVGCYPAPLGLDIKKAALLRQLEVGCILGWSSRDQIVDLLLLIDDRQSGLLDLIGYLIF
tara:strand:+ start:3494 stop:3682 length:189 start_codon:yes stop_codon:yes gene_type:complete